MALYVGLKSSREERPEKAAKAEPRWRTMKVEAVGSGQTAVPRGKKGVGRALLAMLFLVYVLLRWQPWTQAGRLVQEMKPLFAAQTPAEKAKVDLEQHKADIAGAARLAALPVDPAGGKALALWQDGLGRWWAVNGQGQLRSSTGPAAKDSLGLPELRGCRVQASEHGQAKRLALALPDGLLKDLLPLQASVASEVRALLLDDPAEPELLTHDGTRCLLSADGWQRRQQRLGLVLSDLAAKKRRAALIDLRYEDSAVVRPAGRG
jgi:hypothetical protein